MSQTTQTDSVQPVKARLDALERELWSQEYLMKIAEFDGATIAPEDGADARGEALGYLTAQHHSLLTSECAKQLVHEAQAAVDTGAETDPTLLNRVRVLARDQREAAAIPEDEAVAWAKLVCEANAVWHKAKPANDWAAFEPYVDQMVDTLKRHAGYLDSQRDPYDVMLDQFERGLTSAQFDAFCDAAKQTIVPLVAAIAKAPRPKADFLTNPVAEPVQRAMSYDLMKLVGLHMPGSTLAFTEHPFSEGFALGDVRVATHIYEDNLMSNVYSVIHEAGHAIYEQNIKPDFAYTCLFSGTSLGIHESQSRLFENTLGRSRAFMAPLLKLLRAHAPEIYNKVSEDELYHAVNIAGPSLIRTEADELTYSLHVMIRYEIEQALFAGEARAADIPRLWNDLTKQYLGLDVPNFTEGCLQDTHWSGGSFGYFPTYALGSAYDAQLIDAMNRAQVPIEQSCAHGDLAPIRSWLNENIWQWGRAKDAPEIIRDACGAAFDAQFFCRYLEDKFSELYKL
ncbi:carboxypeptidase M32 [Collinsella sp. zg1085]|uniref:carboxypeptidase M32 n=1 Tax=Collinsella sp. zg1085 TaxID=2844380 RepID=UPI001C0D464D|nr:carboxypeptidase M32 [Collinsella sp. zg1085]QWT17743.1 carboxypeptidase M32 [Collinsella sp. zg1085]